MQAQLITLTPIEAEVCPPRLIAELFLSLCLHAELASTLHFHAKNTPLIGLAPDHMHSGPVPPLHPRPRLCLSHQGTRARNANPCAEVQLPVLLLYPYQLR